MKTRISQKTFSTQVPNFENKNCPHIDQKPLRICIYKNSANVILKLTTFLQELKT